MACLNRGLHVPCVCKVQINRENARGSTNRIALVALVYGNVGMYSIHMQACVCACVCVCVSTALIRICTCRSPFPPTAPGQAAGLDEHCRNETQRALLVELLAGLVTSRAELKKTPEPAIADRCLAA